MSAGMTYKMLVFGKLQLLLRSWPHLICSTTRGAFQLQQTPCHDEPLLYTLVLPTMVIPRKSADVSAAPKLNKGGRVCDILISAVTQGLLDSDACQACSCCHVNVSAQLVTLVADAV